METVCVVGLGYVGLPLACLCADKGFKVKGLELSGQKVALINRGKSPIMDKALESDLKRLKGKISAETSPKKALPGSGIIIVCVPTPAVDQKPDLSFVKAACEAIAPYVSAGKRVIIESTVYPGTVEEIVKPILEKGSSLRAGRDFFLGHCPERIDPGNRHFTIGKIPRVLACLSLQGTKKAIGFYQAIIDAEITVLSNVKSAEAVKVVENTFRDVNIAFVNELAKSFDKMGIDLLEVIKGAGTKPFGFMPFYPGPGVGGHCIAQDPYYLIERAEEAGFRHSFLRLAREINESMPAYTVKLVEVALSEVGVDLKKASVAVLGLAYKPNIDDLRESPSLKIVELLNDKVGTLAVFDPFVPEKSTVSSVEEAISKSDCVLLATNHSQFLNRLSADRLKRAGVKSVVDSRNSLDKEGLEKRGIVYKGIGR